ncbi:MAG TPA: efflux RND transporter periplasmic adaptor subunit [Candidatus Polarisedimenticolia bacterium]|nr:efflux RND transporter periplasmic adaptor subunit [Candidatus Polarisedimenticolia bacterium]
MRRSSRLPPRLCARAPALPRSLRAVALPAALSVLFAAASLSSLPAQGPGGMPPSPVRYTEAKEYPVRRTIQLPGSVESRTVSLVAGEVEGLVAKLEAREGDTVRKGQVLARLRTASLELALQAAAAQLKEAESRLKLAEINLARARDLAASQVVAQQELDNATYDLSAWQGRVETLQAQIARIRLDLELSVIRAPFAGLVVSERTEVGQWLAEGGPVIELLALDDLEVRVEVPERFFTNLNPGAAAAVVFESLGGLSVAGRVSAVVPRADPEARTFPLKVTIPNREGRIGVGMLAHVTFPAGESYRATVVPKDAVVTQGRERFVYRIGDDGTAQLVAVTPGQGVGDWVAVEGELKPGEKVVTRGNERLRPGLPVRGELLEYRLP